MSRSYRKRPVTGMTNASSEKGNKRAANRTYRRTINHILKQGIEDLPALEEVSERWTFDKDGKQRFDPDLYPEELGK